jgi:hypothetical protein
MGFALALAIACSVVSAHAVTYNATLAGAAYWPLPSVPPQVLGVIDVSAPRNRFVEEVTDLHSGWAVVGGGAIGAGLYATMVLTGLQQLFVTVHDMRANGTLVNTAKLANDVEEVQCSPGTRRCYGVVLERAQLLMFDPLAHPLSYVVVANYTGWVTLTEGSSTFDDAACVYYAAMSKPTGPPTLVAFDVHRATVIPVPGDFAVATGSGPYCTDPLFGVLAVNTKLGGIVTVNTTTGAITVLRNSTTGPYIPQALTSRNGIIAVGGYDQKAFGHPFRLQAFDLYDSEAAPFYDAVPAAGGPLLEVLAFIDDPTRNF